MSNLATLTFLFQIASKTVSFFLPTETTLHDVTPKSFSEIFTGPQVTLPSLVLVKKVPNEAVVEVAEEQPTLDTFVPLKPTDKKPIFATPIPPSIQTSTSTSEVHNSISSSSLPIYISSTPSPVVPLMPINVPNPEPPVQPIQQYSVNNVQVTSMRPETSSQDPYDVPYLGPEVEVVSYSRAKFEDKPPYEPSNLSPSLHPPTADSPPPIVTLSRERPGIHKSLKKDKGLVFVTPRYVPIKYLLTLCEACCNEIVILFRLKRARTIIEELSL